jgi:hypothetical protein
LPAAVSLRKQGASKGAVTSFLISTPESGVDSIAVTYALLDPIMTVLRPIAAFFTAVVAGVSETLLFPEEKNRHPQPDLTCPVDGCCDGKNCSPGDHRRHHTFLEKLRSGLRYAFTDFWGDLVGVFFVGLILAGIISALIPDSFFTSYLGQGLPAMLIMLVAGIPLYVCATASTPIAAALILKGVSPGAALVFLLAGPATNMAALAVLVRTLGKRSTIVYVAAIATCALFFGIVVDGIYHASGIDARAAVGEASEAIPRWLAVSAAVLLVVLSLNSFKTALTGAAKRLSGVFTKAPPADTPSPPADCRSLSSPTCGPT